VSGLNARPRVPADRQVVERDSSHTHVISPPDRTASRSYRLYRPNKVLGGCRRSACDQRHYRSRTCCSNMERAGGNAIDRLVGRGLGENSDDGQDHGATNKRGAGLAGGVTLQLRGDGALLLVALEEPSGAAALGASWRTGADRVAHKAARVARLLVVLLGDARSHGVLRAHLDGGHAHAGRDVHGRAGREGGRREAEGDSSSDERHFLKCICKNE